MVHRRILAALALIALFATAHAQTLYVDGDPEAGESKAQSCAACHGAAGNSGNGEWPNLAGQHAKYLYDQLRHYKSGERENAIMAGQVGNLSDEDMRDLSAYYAGLEMEVGGANEDVVALGEKIYRGGLPAKDVPACAACHGPVGLGDPGANYPRLGGQKAQYTATTLQDYRSGARSGYEGADIMNAIAKNLSDEEIQAVSSFMSGLYADD